MSWVLAAMLTWCSTCCDLLQCSCRAAEQPWAHLCHLFGAAVPRSCNSIDPPLQRPEKCGDNALV
jgi:hypothetical protein